MSDRGTFKIATLGPPKDIPNKKDPNKPWRSWSLQFEGDNQWYDTFWVQPEDPHVGQELTGQKSYDEKWNTYKFEIDRPGGKNNWNPAGAQATVMSASVQLIGGFLALPGHYELWTKNDPKLKSLFEKYLATVKVASGQVKELVVGMGSISGETKTEEKSASAATSGDPGPTPPPDVDSFGAEDEEINVDELPL